ADPPHMRPYQSPDGSKEAEPVEIPGEIADAATAYRTRLVEAIVETDEAIMERYLADEEISGEELTRALEKAVESGAVFPVLCGAATKTLGTTALLDLVVEAVPSP